MDTGQRMLMTSFFVVLKIYLKKIIKKSNNRRINQAKKQRAAVSVPKDSLILSFLLPLLKTPPHSTGPAIIKKAYMRNLDEEGGEKNRYKTEEMKTLTFLFLSTSSETLASEWLIVEFCLSSPLLPPALHALNMLNGVTSSRRHSALPSKYINIYIFIYTSFSYSCIFILTCAFFFIIISLSLLCRV